MAGISGFELGFPRAARRARSRRRPRAPGAPSARCVEGITPRTGRRRYADACSGSRRLRSSASSPNAIASPTISPHTSPSTAYRRYEGPHRWCGGRRSRRSGCSRRARPAGGPRPASRRRASAGCREAPAGSPFRPGGCCSPWRPRSGRWPRPAAPAGRRGGSPRAAARRGSRRARRSRALRTVSWRDRVEVLAPALDLGLELLHGRPVGLEQVQLLGILPLELGLLGPELDDEAVREVVGERLGGSPSEARSPLIPWSCGPRWRPRGRGSSRRGARARCWTADPRSGCPSSGQRRGAAVPSWRDSVSLPRSGSRGTASPGREGGTWSRASSRCTTVRRRSRCRRPPSARFAMQDSSTRDVPWIWWTCEHVAHPTRLGRDPSFSFGSGAGAFSDVCVAARRWTADSRTSRFRMSLVSVSRNMASTPPSRWAAGSEVERVRLLLLEVDQDDRAVGRLLAEGEEGRDGEAAEDATNDQPAPPDDDAGVIRQAELPLRMGVCRRRLEQGVLVRKVLPGETAILTLRTGLGVRRGGMSAP